jgi:hypothetical protein
MRIDHVGFGFGFGGNPNILKANARTYRYSKQVYVSHTDTHTDETMKLLFCVK